MRIRLTLTTLLLLASFAFVGCQESQSSPGGQSLGIVSINELASSLGLTISNAKSTHVTLKNSANTVMIFTFSGGQVYVNSKPVATTGKVSKKSTGIFVSESLVDKIRTAMTGAYSPPTTTSYRKSGCIVVDAGHGGKDPGATSCLGYYEKIVNLQVAQKVASLLKRKGFEVLMTRESDRYIELEERAAVANRCNADLFVSIHADSAANKSARGFTIYIARSASRASQTAAKAITRAMSKVSPDGRNIQRGDYRVLINTRGPAVLVELGYLSNRQEASLLKNSTYQNRLASAISSGISEFLQ